MGATLQEAFLRISHKSKYLECLSYRPGIKNDFLSLLRSCGKPMWLSTCFSVWLSSFPTYRSLSKMACVRIVSRSQTAFIRWKRSGYARLVCVLVHVRVCDIRTRAIWGPDVRYLDVIRTIRPLSWSPSAWTVRKNESTVVVCVCSSFRSNLQHLGSRPTAWHMRY